MQKPMAAATTILLALTLAACGNQAAQMPSANFSKPGTSLKLDPSDAPNCKPDTTFRTTVRWSVDAVDTPKTEIRIGKLDGSLFARSNDRTARAETGDWVKPGMWFLLFDRRNNQLLGAVRAGPKPCP